MWKKVVNIVYIESHEKLANKRKEEAEDLRKIQRELLLRKKIF